MLSRQNLIRQDLGKAASYYNDAADDYYAKEGEAAVWQGKGADMLGLHGAVDRERFKELLDGRISKDIRVSRKSRHKDSPERIGLDLTFSAPKSVSIQALIGRDPAIIQAHDRAVAAAVAAAEQRALVRKKVKGKTVIETTGNLIVAKFRHETSRELDPQLHTHAVVMNLTLRSDGEWRSLKNDDIVKSLAYLDAVYRSELAVELQRLGYQLRQERDGKWELAHISREQLMEFSQRSQQIEERLAAQGLDRMTATVEQKQQATMRTRAKKQPHVDREALFQDWTDRAHDLGIDFTRRDWHAGDELEKDRPKERQDQNPTYDDTPRQPGGGAPPRGKERDTRTPTGPKTKTTPPHAIDAETSARLAVRYAINHLTERQSIIQESELMKVAMQHALGTVRISDVEKEIKTQLKIGFLVQESPVYKPLEGVGNPRTRIGWIEHLVQGGMSRAAATQRVDEGISTRRLKAIETRYTTQTAIKYEKAILAIERDGRGKVAPIMPPEAIAKAFTDSKLNAGQRQSATMILTTTNRVIGVQGRAGVGKSRMLNEATKQIEKQGYEVRVLAPYGSQVKDLRANKLTANTLASFLKGNRHINTLHEKSVVVLDEAAIVPTRLMERLMKVIEQKGARLVLLGDTEQTKAIEAGRPFGQLQAAGMQTGQMTEIQRQKDPELKKAVELAASGKTTESLNKIRDVLEIKEDGERRAQIVKDFTELTSDERGKSLIITGTNESRRALNKGLRSALGTEGKGTKHDVLLRLDTTQAERRFSKNYSVGLIIQPEKDYANGMKRGKQYRVLDTGPGNTLTVENVADVSQRISFSPLTHTKLSVYGRESLEFSIGDQVRITRNDAARDLANGDRFTVAQVTNDKLVLEGNNRRIELDATKAMHVDYAYVSTIHGSQGLTASRVFYEALSKSRTTARDIFYVAISRAEHLVKVYTDNHRDLPGAIARENVKHAALDLKRERHPARQQQYRAREKTGQERSV